MGSAFSYERTQEENVREKILHYRRLSNMSHTLHEKLGHEKRLLELQRQMLHPTEKEVLAMGITYIQLGTLYRDHDQKKDCLERALDFYKADLKRAEENQDKIGRCHYLLAHLNMFDTATKEKHLKTAIASYQYNKTLVMKHRPEVADCFYAKAVFCGAMPKKIENLQEALNIYLMDLEGDEKYIDRIAQCHYFLATLVESSPEKLMHLTSALDLYEKNADENQENRALCYKMRVTVTPDKEQRNNDLKLSQETFNQTAEEKANYNEKVRNSFTTREKHVRSVAVATSPPFPGILPSL